MLEQYFIAFFWGWGILLSWIGYGGLLNVILAPEKKFSWGIRASFGLALSATVGGFLNFAKAISINSIGIFIFSGLLLFALFCFRERRGFIPFIKNTAEFVKKNKLFSAAVVLVCAIILSRYACAVSFFSFHAFDDDHAYMSFPAKMLQTGSLGNDPFSERRVESSLGGKYFLDAIILAPAAFKNLHLADNGLGYLVLILLLVGFLKERKVDRRLGLATVFFLAITATPVSNITACYLAAALFFTFFWLMCTASDRQTSSVVRAAFLFALPAAALVILKSTFISAIAVMSIGYFYLNIRQPGRFQAALKEFAIFGLIVLTCLLPWMIAMLESSGTLLYPIFGLGYYGTAYGAFQHGVEFNLYSLMRLFFECFNAAIMLVPLLVLSAFSFVLAPNKERNFLQVILFGSLAGVLSIVFLIGGYGLYYYSFPYLLPAMLFFIVLCLGGTVRSERWPNFNGRLVGLILMAFLAGGFFQRDLTVVQEMKNSLNIDGGRPKIGLMNSDPVSPEELKQYTNLQKAVPAGAIIVARLDKNYLFDFKRNPVFINDIPGGASLPPGLPLKNGSEAMADYFLSQHIKYMAYSYGNEANFTRQLCASMLRAHVNPLLHAQTENSFAFQDYLMELSKTRKKIYDDGKNFVLDLSVKNNKNI